MVTVWFSLPLPHLAGRQVGKGAFKSVYEGEFRGRRVAVLRLKAGSCDTEADVFLRLGRRPGLVQFIGMCCERPDEQLLLTEFAPHGSLSEFLSDDERVEQLTMEHKLHMLHQVGRWGRLTYRLRRCSWHFAWDLSDRLLKRDLITPIGSICLTSPNPRVRLL